MDLKTIESLLFKIIQDQKYAIIRRKANNDGLDYMEGKADSSIEAFDKLFGNYDKFIEHYRDIFLSAIKQNEEYNKTLKEKT